MTFIAWTLLLAAGAAAPQTRAPGTAAPPTEPALAAAARGPAVTFLTADQLRQAIDSAPEETPEQPGLEAARLSITPAWQVMEIRRTVAQRSEVHAAMADVWYVLRGEATLVVGGTLTGSEEVAPGETRGRGVTGGEEHALRGGEVVVIPAGVPHWISKVGGGEVVYLVVKIPAPR